MKVVIARHGHYPGFPFNLDPEGRSQATNLGLALEGMPRPAIVRSLSNEIRARETAEIAAEKMGAQYCEPYLVGSVRQGFDGAPELLGQHARTQTLVLIGHGESIPTVARALAQHIGIVLPEQICLALSEGEGLLLDSDTGQVCCVNGRSNPGKLAA